VLMRPRGLIIGAIILVGEKGSKEARAVPRPAILPLVSLSTGRGGLGAEEGLAFWLTRADQDLGGCRGGGGAGDAGEGVAGDEVEGVDVLSVSTGFGIVGLGDGGTEFE